MRLTLRTLLAYVDDLLDQNDAQEIAQRIEQSEFATELMHRRREVMRRLALGAEEVLATGLGRDANTVAEYLDNTLPTDQVADFERFCLESDMHLAEVASCHQILTLVLKAPADVDSMTRARCHRLGSFEHAAHEHASHSADRPDQDVTADEAVAEIPRRVPSRGERPEYLKRRSTWPGRLLLVAAAVGVPTFLAWYAQKPADDPHVPPVSNARIELPPVPNALDRNPIALTDTPPANSRSPLPPDEGTRRHVIRSRRTSSLAPSEDPWNVDAATSTFSQIASPFNAGENSPGRPTEGPPVSLEPYAKQHLSDPLTSRARQEPNQAGAVDPSHPSGDARLPVPYVLPEVVEPSPHDPLEQDPQVVNEPVDEEGFPAAPGPWIMQPSIPGSLDGALPTSGDRSRNAALQPADSSPTATPRRGFGHDTSEGPWQGLGPAGAAPGESHESALSEKSDTSIVGEILVEGAAPAPDIEPTPRNQPVDAQSLPWRVTSLSVPVLRLDTSLNHWSCVHPEEDLNEGEQLLIPPSARAELQRSSGEEITIVGPTLVSLGKGESGWDLLDIRDGTARITLRGTSAPVLVHLGDYEFQVASDGGDVALAVRASWLHVPQERADGEASRCLAGIYVESGRASLAGPHSQPAQTLETGTLFQVIRASMRMTSMPSAPAWAIRAPASQADRRVENEIWKRVNKAAAAEEALLEMAKVASPREARAAILTLAWMGYHDPAIAALREVAQKAAWDDSIDVLRRTMARGPRPAEAVRESVHRILGPVGKDAFRLLRGWTLEEFRQGGATTLVAGLDHDDPAIRVLSFYNLKELTGAGAYYRPELGPAQRRQKMSTWRQWLKDGRIYQKATARAAARAAEEEFSASMRLTSLVEEAATRR